jgi:hypothetical protein
MNRPAHDLYPQTYGSRFLVTSPRVHPACMNPQGLCNFDHIGAVPGWTVRYKAL